MDKAKFVNKTKIRIFIIALLCVFIIIAFWGYCYEQETEPIRVVFITKGGPVVFEHLEHTSPDGYELECESCHHNYSTEETKNENTSMNCRECHYSKKLKTVCEDADVHKRCIGENCMQCHEENCEFCHKQAWK
jgi:hypothetical protein